MKYMYAIALGVAKNRSLPPPPSVPADYGRLLTNIQKELGLSDRQLSKLAGYKAGPKDNTMGRLRRGEGSIRQAMAVRDVLVRAGGEVPPVPISGTGTSVDATEQSAWLREWIELGNRLHEHASEAQFEKYVADLRELVGALEKVARHMAAIAHPLAR